MNRTLATRGLLIWAFFLAPTLLFSQVRGITPTPQLWDWYSIEDHPFQIWYSVPRRASDRGSLRDYFETLSRDSLALAKEAAAEYTEVLGKSPPGIPIQVTNILPADRKEIRYFPSRGGVLLMHAPDDLQRLGRDRWLRRQVRLQVAEAFLWHHLHERRNRNLLRRYLLRRLPPAWLLVGLAANLAGPASDLEDQVLRTSLRNREPIPLQALTVVPSLSATRREEAFQQVRDFSRFLKERFGIDPLLEYLTKLRRSPTRPSDTFARVFGAGLEVLRSEWAKEVRARDQLLRAKFPAPEFARKLSILPGYSGALTVSPDYARFALGVSHRYPQGRLLDLTTLRRFGDLRLTFRGGNALTTRPAWISDRELVTVEEDIRPFGQRRTRLVLRRLEELTDPEETQLAPGFAKDFASGLNKALASSRRFLDQGFRTDSKVLLDETKILEVAASPAKRRIALLTWRAGKKHLEVWQVRPAGSTSGEPMRRLEETSLEGARGIRLTREGDRLLFLRASLGGDEILERDLDSGETKSLLKWDQPLRSTHGSRAQTFFVEDRQGVSRLLELDRLQGTIRTHFEDPSGILSAEPLEDGRWLAYLRPHPEGTELVEVEVGRGRALRPREWAARAREPRSSPTVASPSSFPETRFQALDEKSPLDLEIPDPEPIPGLELGSPSAPPTKPYRPQYLKRNDRYVLDEDTAGVTFEWRDAFFHRAIQGAMWKGREPHANNWQALYVENRERPAWFVGAFDADREDLLGQFLLADFQSAIAQKGFLGGLSWQASPIHSWVFMAEKKTLEYNPRDFQGRLTNLEPDTNVLRLNWTLNELAATPFGSVAPLGRRWARLSLARSAFGGDAKYWEFLGDMRTYLPLQRSTDAFAARLAFGFRNPDQSSAQIPLDFSLGGPESLRGIRNGSLRGENFLQTSFEVRREFTNRTKLKEKAEDLNLGWVLDPFHFDKVYAAFFLDMGTAYTQSFQWGNVEKGIGVEFRTLGLVTALRPVQVRLGFAHGFGPLGVNDVYLVTSAVF